MALLIINKLNLWESHCCFKKTQLLLLPNLRGINNSYPSKEDETKTEIKKRQNFEKDDEMPVPKNKYFRMLL